METESATYYVLRVKTYPKALEGTSRPWNWRYLMTRYAAEQFTTRIEEATTFTSDDVGLLIKAYQSCLRKCSEDEVEYVKVSTTTTIEQINLNEDAYLEERRRVALSKLTTDDIKALGVESLATYNKLKYYGSS